MRLSDLSVPDIYKQSADFRFFLKWLSTAFEVTQYDIENILDLYDPLRCKSELLWMLADTMGFKYDDRFPVAYNRLVLMYFMSMIRNRGSKDGMTLAAETNLAQFRVEEDGQRKEELYTRLEDTSIPVNAAYVNSFPERGYIEIVYFSDRKPVDACIEYVRPIGMYCIQNAGVRYDGRTKISVDARLTNTSDLGISIGATHIGHYRREDYASIQKISVLQESEREQICDKVKTRLEKSLQDRYHQAVDPTVTFVAQNTSSGLQDQYVLRAQYTVNGTTYTQYLRSVPESDDYLASTRNPVYYRNSVFEETTNPDIDPGYRSLHSLQLSNNTHIVESLLHEPIFSLGYEPQDVGIIFPDEYYNNGFRQLNEPEDPYNPDVPIYNLGMDHQAELDINIDAGGNENDTFTAETLTSIIEVESAVNPIMSSIGDAMMVEEINGSAQEKNTAFTNVKPDGKIELVDENGEPLILT